MDGRSIGPTSHIVCHLSIDTRTIVTAADTFFAALPGSISDGHQHIQVAYDLGVRAFLVKAGAPHPEYDDAAYVVVDDVLAAIQALASYHRSQFHLPVLAITGSNGKTIVKEWLYQMLYSRYYIVKSPKSYNSQIGVPLSLMQMNSEHTLAIIEAGISRPDEMEHHARMIKPTMGIFTNIGDAHASGFESRQQKIAEKLKLFANCQQIICCLDHTEIYHAVREAYPHKEVLAWSMTVATAQLYAQVSMDDETHLHISYLGTDCRLYLQDYHPSAIENTMHSIAAMLLLGIPMEELQPQLAHVAGLSMRLEMKAGIKQSVIINDAYSADISALKIGLEFMQLQHPDRSKVLILGKLEQSGLSEADTLQLVQVLTDKHELEQVHYISDYDGPLPDRFVQHSTKSSLLQQLPYLDIARRAILVKGPRSAKLEDVVYQLANKGHSTRLTINLDALAHNVRVYKSTLKPDTEIIAVIKAAAYGSGSVEVARLLASSGVSRLAVAFVDEAITLRQQGVSMPIIVFNADIMSLADVLEYNLELEVYTKEQLIMLGNYSLTTQQQIAIHLKLDTGMHRLGFTEEQLSNAIALLQKYNMLKVSSIFSHLAASEDPAHDEYTKAQCQAFESMYAIVCQELTISPPRHILNSSGISRFANYQYNMVRLGLGLYGIDTGGILSDRLQKVHTLTSKLLQVKQLYKGDSVGYSRRTMLDTDTLTGVVNIGYADGLLRNLGNRNYAVLIQGQPADIIGTVSMDLIIVDLSKVQNPHVGMAVTIFDESHSIEKLAKQAGTIPYEVLSRISERVERLYIRS